MECDESSRHGSRRLGSGLDMPDETRNGSGTRHPAQTSAAGRQWPDARQVAAGIRRDDAANVEEGKHSISLIFHDRNENMRLVGMVQPRRENDLLEPPPWQSVRI